MDNRDSILRRLAALKAKFAEGSGCTEAEAESAMKMYNDLMQRYNIEETDVHIRQEGIGFSAFSYKEGKQKHEVYWCLTAIGELTDTKPVVDGQNVTFFGTKPDRDYAEFLYRLTIKSLETEWKAFRYSFNYTKLHRRGVHGKKIRHSFRTAFINRLAKRMRDMAGANKIKESSTGTALVLLKAELIDAFLAEKFGKLRKGGEKQTRLSTSEAAEAGRDSADKVRLRQEVDDPTRLLGSS